jgi:hypothetical protein
LLKAPFFDVTIDPFGSWKHFDDQVDKDTAIFTVSVMLLAGFYFLSWWWFLFVAGILLLNVIVFLVWMFFRARKNGSDTGTEIAVLKGTLKNKIKRK